MKAKKHSLLISILSLILCFSLLLGTTFAWFTDKVVSGKNTIAAGNLDVELYHSNAAVQNEQVKTDTLLFKDLQGNPILWEPGVVSYENLRVTNAGDLALSYQLAMETAKENFVVYPDGTQYGLSQILKVGIVEGGITATDRAGVLASVADANWTTLTDFIQNGTLTPAGKGVSEKTWGVVVYWQPGENDNLWNLNNGKQLNEGETLSIELGVKLTATQEPFENDSFDKNYDAQYVIPNVNVTVTETVADKAENDTMVQTVTVADTENGVTAQIPKGVALVPGAQELTLSVVTMESSQANVKAQEGETKVSLDVHIEGVAETNTAPMQIKLENYLPKGMNSGNLKLYHVEDGQTVEMTRVDVPTAHNQYSYDPATGVVILSLAGFSEVAVIADTSNPWDGTSAATGFAGGSGTEADPYLIANAEQLVYFRNQVDGGNTYAGQYVKLVAPINLNGKIFDPIGWGYDYDGYTPNGKTFNGTFDGDHNTISGLYQNGWDLEAATGTDYTYSMAGGGLFASAVDATFKNIHISGANITMECVDMGILLGYAQGNCTFDHIRIYNSKIANYQRATGGVIGEVSPKRDASGNPIGTSTHTIKDVVLGNQVVVGTLWGDFDAPVGGVIGARWDDDNTTYVVMENVTVGCRLDVYNDVTAAYRWHNYRRAGMLIGNTDTPPADGKTAKQATADFLTCKYVDGIESVVVEWGDWVDYQYCQFTNENNPGKNYPWVRVQSGENNSAYSNPRYGHPVDAAGKSVVDDIHTHREGDTCRLALPFAQLYGGGQGIYGATKHDGVRFEKPVYTIAYMNGAEVEEVIYVNDNTKPYLLKEFTNTDGKTYQWIDREGKPITEIPAGNTKNIVVYKDDTEIWYAYFVDFHGVQIAQIKFDENTTNDELKAQEPAVPPMEGFHGRWEHYELENAKGSIVIKPVYSRDENATELFKLSLSDLFEYISNGMTVVMSESLEGSQGNASKETCCTVTTNTSDREAR